MPTAKKPTTAQWDGFRCAAASHAKSASFDLSAIDPRSKPFSSGDKTADQTQIQTLGAELDGLQNLFFADKRYKLLVILQGTDTSGKDGTIRSVFGQMSPLGCTP
jgi:polyphosphate kinase 2 (PPK2 family)